MGTRTPALANIALALALAFACRDRPSCETADYSECGTPLPATQYNGQPWPTLSEAVAKAQRACIDDPGQGHVRGMCADGKQFVATNGPFAGETQYFQGETLVGTASYSDTGFGPCQCQTESFQGTLASVRCDAPLSEDLCESSTPMAMPTAGAHMTFSQGKPTEFACSCDDPGYR